MLDIYRNVPRYSNKDITIRKTELNDGLGLMRCYTSRAQHEIKEVSPVLIDMLNSWEVNYSLREAVRFTVIDNQSIQLIGTFQMSVCEIDPYKGYGFMKFDLKPEYENDVTLDNIFSLVNMYLMAAFEVTNMIIKTKPNQEYLRTYLANKEFVPIKTDTFELENSLVKIETVTD